MKFKKALKYMQKGRKIKRPFWGGYWFLDNKGEIKIYCVGGEVIDFKETNNILFTLGNVLANDWEVVEE